MIDRTQLTEALATWRHDEEAQDVIAEAARLLVDFPTDEMVRAAAISDDPKALAIAQLHLEAVRRVMYGEDIK